MKGIKFKPGDKVRIVNFNRGTERKDECNIDVGDVLTIKTVCSDIIIGDQAYTVKEVPGWAFFDSELELVTKQNTIELHLTIPLDDKKQAHSLVHNLVERAYEEKAKERKKWTEEEIDLAKSKIAEWVNEAVLKGDDVGWDSYNNIVISCYYHKGLQARIPDMIYGQAKPSGDDVYNEWIGKCVSLAKAMGKPVPGFITHKNTGVK